MKFTNPLYLEPYRDPYGLGFALSARASSQPPCRQRTIVAVIFSAADEQAQFVNGAGLVVPAKFNLDTLAPLLRRHAVRQEFGRVFGEGQFALKPAALKALESSGRLKSWVAHWLPAPAGYLDDAGAWATYVEGEQAAERDAFAKNHAAAVELGRHRGGGVELPWSAALAAEPAAYDAALHQQLEQRRAELDAWRRDELAKSVQLAAWLRGNMGGPPLLAMMKGAA